MKKKIYTISPTGYDRLRNTFWPSYIGVKIEINDDINLDTEDHIPYEPFSVVLMDSQGTNLVSL